jgi:hypothetical protein
MPKCLKRFTWFEWLCFSLLVIALLVLMYFGAVYLIENHLKQSLYICFGVVIILFVVRKLRFVRTNRRLRGLLPAKTAVAKLRRDDDDKFRHVYILKSPYAAAAFMEVKSQLKKDLRVANVHLIYDKSDYVCVIVTSRRNSKRNLDNVIENATYH